MCHYFLFVSGERSLQLFSLPDMRRYVSSTLHWYTKQSKHLEICNLTIRSFTSLIYCFQFFELALMCYNEKVLDYKKELHSLEF